MVGSLANLQFWFKAGNFALRYIRSTEIFDQRALADGYSQATTADLRELEEQLADLREFAAASQPETFQLRMREMRKFVEARLRDLQTLFGAEGVTIRAEIARYVQKITLTPEGRTYVVSGTWDLLGEKPWMVPGARIGPNACRCTLNGRRLHDDRQDWASRAFDFHFG